MATIIKCAKTDCIHSQKINPKKTGLIEWHMCRCDVVGINPDGKCDSYMACPDQIKKMKKEEGII